MIPVRRKNSDITVPAVMSPQSVPGGTQLQPHFTPTRPLRQDPATFPRTVYRGWGQ